jgi:transposase
MDNMLGITQLLAFGMSERQTARTLEIDRKSVDRESGVQDQKGPVPQKRPPGPIPAKTNGN